MSGPEFTGLEQNLGILSERVDRVADAVIAYGARLSDQLADLDRRLTRVASAAERFAAAVQQDRLTAAEVAQIAEAGVPVGTAGAAEIRTESSLVWGATRRTVLERELKRRNVETGTKLVECLDAIFPGLLDFRTYKRDADPADPSP